jgi:hypothetical protein
MKPLTLTLLSAYAAHAALVTSVNCKATIGTVLADITNPVSCLATAGSPAFPDIPAYRATASIGNGRLETHVTSIGWVEDRINGPLIYPTVTASASAVFTDTVTFPGTGLATLRVNLSARATSIDNGGSFGYSVNGVGAGVPIDPINTYRSVDRDFNITLGVPVFIRYSVTTSSIAGHGNSDSSGIEYSVGLMRAYGMNGEQLPGLVGIGLDGDRYPSYFSPGDTSMGPVLTTSSEVPEPGPRTLLLICGSIFLLLYNYGVRNVSASSKLPQVTETL